MCLKSLNSRLIDEHSHTTMMRTARIDGSCECVCAPGDGQHPEKSEVDIRLDAFASPKLRSRLD